LSKLLIESAMQSLAFKERTLDRRTFGKTTLGAVAGSTAVASIGNASDAFAQATTATRVPRAIAQLPKNLRTLLDQSHPKFSEGEYARRHRLLGEVMQKNNVDALLLVTWLRVGNATEWVTAWPGLIEAITVFQPGERMKMFVEYFNHMPLAQRMARDCDVQWCEEKGVVKAVDELKKRGVKRVGVIGPLPTVRFRQLDAMVPAVNLDGDYIRLRLFQKSQEELDWLRIGAALSDASMSAIIRETRVGMTEFELANAVERAYAPWGGQHVIHFIGVTPMSNPDCQVPLQFHRNRKVQKGDIVFCELSSAFWHYSGQVLRTFTVESAPTQLYKDLHATAESVYDSLRKIIKPGVTLEEMIEATSQVESNGFTTCDDVVHGYGGGYFQPIIGSKSRPAAVTPKFTLAENMCMVVQPNVVTKDQKAGVQVGEMIRVTKDGAESMHNMPRGLFRSGQIV